MNVIPAFYNSGFQVFNEYNKKTALVRCGFNDIRIYLSLAAKDPQQHQEQVDEVKI